MSSKVLSLLVALLFLLNIFLIFQAVKYRNVIVKRNKCYEDLPKFPRFKNVNYEYKLLKKDISQFDDSVVFIGSSIIERWDFEKYFKNKPFLNRGVGDDTSTDMLNRFEADVVRLKPSKVIIYIGVNDIKYHIQLKQSARNLENMLNKAAHNHIDAYVLVMLPVHYEPNPANKYSRPFNRVNALRSALIGKCEQLNTSYLDLDRFFPNRKDLSELYLKDGLHLNEKGYEILSNLVLRRLPLLS